MQSIKVSFLFSHDYFDIQYIGKHSTQLDNTGQQFASDSISGGPDSFLHRFQTCCFFISCLVFEIMCIVLRRVAINILHFRFDEINLSIW